MTQPEVFEVDAASAMRSLLKSRGFELHDFEIVEDRESELANLLGLTGGIVTVRCISTGEERLYPSGPGSAWYATLLIDLDNGYFRRRTGQHGQQGQQSQSQGANPQSIVMSRITLQ